MNQVEAMNRNPSRQTRTYAAGAPDGRALALLLVLGAAAVTAPPAAALVNFDQGQRTVKGVQLLQDYSDPNAYYYIPKYPRLATKDDGSFEFLCLKYVDPTGKTSGGLFHALIEFTLPPEVQDDLEKELQKTLPQARIAGPVPLMQAVEDGQKGQGSFQVVSAILSDQAEGGFTRTMVTSGTAPLTPGSKAVVAALLEPKGATLLWDSFRGVTSDVSVAIHAYYEAAVQGYNAKVTADVNTVYQHFSQIYNVQKGYTRRQIRDITDDLQRTGLLKVEVMDRTAGLGIKSGDLENILNIVTNKLTEVMFDYKLGWSKDPGREVAVEADQIKGRQEKGWLAQLFTSSGDQPYYTDDQWVMKKRTDITHNSFSVVLAKNSTIRVPVDTAGNLGGLYGALGDDKRYFRIVNLADPAFETRSVHFQVDGEYVDSFKDTINFASVNFRKTYADGPAVTQSLHFSHEDVQAGKTIQEVTFPRLGAKEANWTDYEYQVRWSVRDSPTVSVPADPTRWIKLNDAAVSLVPPFEKRRVEVDADRSLFKDRGAATAVVEIATILSGKPRLTRVATLRAADADSTTTVSVYGDRGTPAAYRVSWHSPLRTVEEDLKVLDTGYLYLVPPDMNPPPAPGGGAPATATTPAPAAAPEATAAPAAPAVPAPAPAGGGGGGQ